MGNSHGHPISRHRGARLRERSSRRWEAAEKPQRGPRGDRALWGSAPHALSRSQPLREELVHDQWPTAVFWGRELAKQEEAVPTFSVQVLQRPDENQHRSQIPKMFLGFHGPYHLLRILGPCAAKEEGG